MKSFWSSENMYNREQTLEYLDVKSGLYEMIRRDSLLSVFDRIIKQCNSYILNHNRKSKPLYIYIYQ